MDILKNKKFRAATWIDANKIVEGRLQIVETDSLKSIDENRNSYLNGYLLVIVDQDEISHIIALDTLEIIENPHFSTITQHLLRKGLTVEELELFWKDCFESAMFKTDEKAILAKSKKWDELEAAISKCYFDDDGNELSEEESENIDLGTIGEIAATKFGFL